MGEGEGFELSDGSVSSSSAGIANEDLLDRKDRREFRKAGFKAMKSVFDVYMAALIWIIVLVIVMAFCGKPNSVPHVALIGAMVGILAGVPLSLALAIRHLSTDGAERRDTKDDDKIASFTTAQAGVLKALLDLTSSLAKHK